MRKDKKKMFNFFSMADNYDERKIANSVAGEAEIDTCYVNDGSHDYETAIAHPSYNGGQWIIVEAYDTPDQAKDGHYKWVNIMSANNLPEYLDDCQNAMISQLLDFKRFVKDTE